MILFEKFGQHQPLNRQAERYAREGVPLSLSTLADQVGAGCAVLAPLLERIEAHVLAAERLHGDDTTVPVLAKGKTDHRAMLDLCARRSARSAAPRRRRRCSTTRATAAASIRRRHLANYAGIFQADAYGGYNELYEPDRKPGPIIEAACWAHAPAQVLRPGRCRRERRPHGARQSSRRRSRRWRLEAVRRIDALFDDRARSSTA